MGRALATDGSRIVLRGAGDVCTDVSGSASRGGLVAAKATEFIFDILRHQSAL
jgi:hypothetical protein